MKECRYPGLLYSLLEERVGTDLEIVCKDGAFSCHAVMLAVSEQWWRNLLEPSEQSIVLLPDMGKVEVEKAVQLLYSGSVEGTNPELFIPTLNSLFPSLSLQLERMVGTVSPLQDPIRESASSDIFTDIPDISSSHEVPDPDSPPGSPELTKPCSDQSCHQNIEYSLNEEVAEMCEVETSSPKPKPSPYSCQLCEKAFTYSKDLKNHLLVHEDRKPFVCRICLRPSRTISNMYQHLRTNHSLFENLRNHIQEDSGNQLSLRDDDIREKVKNGSVNKLFLDINYVKSVSSVRWNTPGVPSYTCLVCKKWVLSTTLRNHLKTHDISQFKYRCESCDKSYCTSSSLSYHISTSHPTLPRLKCNICPARFNTLSEKQEHLKSCTDKKKDYLSCKFCSKRFNRKSNLNAHMRTHQGGRSIKPLLNLPCDQCGKLLVGRRNWLKHNQTSHNIQPSCNLCRKEFNTVDSLLQHIKKHCVQQKIEKKCVKCSATFSPLVNSTRFCDLCRKISPVESSQTKSKFKCDKCDEVFNELKKLKIHKKSSVHQKTKNSFLYKCQHCLAEKKLNNFSSASRYRRHLQTHKCAVVIETKKKNKDEDDEDDGKDIEVEGSGASREYGDIKCKHCAKDSPAATRLIQHIRRWNESKIFSCPSCPRLFSTQQILSVHSLVHTKEKPFHCDLCGERFTQKSSLQMHIKRHKSGSLDPQNLICKDCGKLCKNLAGFKKHILFHANSSRVNDNLEKPGLERTDGEPGEPGGVLLDSTLSGLFRLDSSSSSFFDQFQVTTINIDGMDQDLNYKIDNAPGLAYRTEHLPGVNYRLETLHNSDNFRTESVPAGNYRSEPVPGVSFRSELNPGVSYITDTLANEGFSTDTGEYRTNLLQGVEDQSSVFFSLPKRDENVCYELKDGELAFDLKDGAGPSYPYKDADSMFLIKGGNGTFISKDSESSFVTKDGMGVPYSIPEGVSYTLKDEDGIYYTLKEGDNLSFAGAFPVTVESSSSVKDTHSFSCRSKPGDSESFENSEFEAQRAEEDAALPFLLVRQVETETESNKIQDGDGERVPLYPLKEGEELLYKIQVVNDVNSN